MPPIDESARPPKPEGQGDLVFCSKLEKWAPRVARVPWGGKLGVSIRENVSEEAWQEWLKMEVMVINELRLNFMDPKAQDVLIAQMRQFLVLPD